MVQSFLFMKPGWLTKNQVFILQSNGHGQLCHCRRMQVDVPDCMTFTARLSLYYIKRPNQKNYCGTLLYSCNTASQLALHIVVCLCSHVSHIVPTLTFLQFVNHSPEPKSRTTYRSMQANALLSSTVALSGKLSCHQPVLVDELSWIIV